MRERDKRKDRNKSERLQNKETRKLTGNTVVCQR